MKADYKLAKDIIKALRKRGFSAYIVGGAVRDHILKRKPNDVDVATNALFPYMEQTLEKEFNTFDIGKNKDFGVMVVEKDGVKVEVAQFREDGCYTDGRRPDNIKYTSSFTADAARRDFTINALAMDDYGNILDPTGGLNDIRNKKIRAVGIPNDRFEEDHLRVLRAIRFSTELGFEISDDTLHAIRKYAPYVAKISSERVKKELDKILASENREFGIRDLEINGILKYILPEVQRMVGCTQGTEHHPEGDVFEHTMLALDSYPGDDPLVAWCILLHDVGKPATQQIVSKEKVSFKHHATAGVGIAMHLCERLRFSNYEKDVISYCIQNHMKFHDILEMRKSKLKRFINEAHFEHLIETARADVQHRKDLKEEFVKILDRIEEMRGELAQPPLAKKVISGNDIMEIMGIKPGPLVGTIKRKTEDLFLEGVITNEAEARHFVEVCRMAWNSDSNTGCPSNCF